MKTYGGLHAASSFNWIFSLILITTCCFRAAFGYCDIMCTQEYDPVCGSDGETYSNECAMTAADCRSERNITVTHRGSCREAVTTTKRSCDVACPLIYNPVCGSDGVTYSNECEMTAADCWSNKSVNVTHRGRCREAVTTTERSCAVMCPDDYDPVCGSDGVTYSNECYLTAANCRSERSITKTKRGRCSRERSCDWACPANYDPVCGSDGTTYGNNCELRSHRCMNKSRLRVVCKGVCRRDRRTRRLTCRRSPPQN